MIDQKTEKVACCNPIAMQHATNAGFSATVERNTNAINSLKALAGEVLVRNSLRNNHATYTLKHTQQIGQKKGAFVAHNLTDNERTHLTGWLSHIGETDAESIAEFWHNIQHKEGAREYFLSRAITETIPDYLRHCRECRHLTKASRYCSKLRFRPVDDIPRNCDKFKE